MSRSLIQVEIKDKTHHVPFTMGVLEHLEQLTGEDPYKFVIPVDNVRKFREGVARVVYAALLSNSEVKGESPDYTEDDVNRYIKGLTFEEVTSIIRKYRGAYGTASGEGSGDTQGRAADVGADT